MDCHALKAAFVSRARRDGYSSARIGAQSFGVLIYEGRPIFSHCGYKVDEETFTRRLAARIITHPIASKAVYKEIQQ